MEAKLQQQAPQKAQTYKPNLTGIPTQMKLDFERQSGLSFDDVRVHYNSDKPAQLQALAYTQGTQVYVGPGQERHLKHELGHVVQQKTGIVKPTAVVNGISINDSSELEEMADQITSIPSIIQKFQANNGNTNVVQCALPSVSVSLVPTQLYGKPMHAAELMVDTINISGRFNTGLISDTNSPTQGDHIVADVLDKRAQKAAVKGKSLVFALNTYYNKCNELKTNITFIWDNIVTNMVSLTSFSYQDCVSLKKYTIPSNFVAFDLKQLGFPASTFSRFSSAYEWACKVQNHINHIFNKQYTVSEWNIALEKIIFAYNNAYARSPYSAQGYGGTGGRGEHIGNRYLSALKSGDFSRFPHAGGLETLYDKKSEKKIQQPTMMVDGKVIFDKIMLIRSHLAPAPISFDISDIITTLEKNQKTFNSYGYIPILPSVLHYIDDLYEVIKSESKIGNRRHFARTTHNTFYKDAQ